MIWVVYGYSMAFTDGGSLNTFVGGFSKVFLAGRRRHDAGGHLLERRLHPGVQLHHLPDDLRLHHPGADRRRLRRADASSRRCSSSSCSGSPSSTSRWRTWSGGGAGPTSSPTRRRCSPRRRRPATGRHRRGERDARGERHALQLGRARLRGRNGGAHQRRHRRPRRLPRDRPAHRLRQGADAAALARHDHDRRVAALGGLVRLQRRLEPRSRTRSPRSRSSTPSSRPPAAAAAWMFAEWVFKGKPSLLGLVSGAVAGLVAVTPASGFAGPMGSHVPRPPRRRGLPLLLHHGEELLRLRRQPRRLRGALHRRHHRRDRRRASWSIRRWAGRASPTTSRSPGRCWSRAYVFGTAVLAQVKAVIFTLVFSGRRLVHPLQDRGRLVGPAAERRYRARGPRPRRARRARLRPLRLRFPHLARASARAFLFLAQGERNISDKNARV